MQRYDFYSDSIKNQNQILFLNFLIFAKTLKLIRVVSHPDWVIYCVIGIALSYIIMFRTLHRDISLYDFLLQPFENVNNTYLSWAITTILHCISFSVLFSQYIPVVPKFVSENFSGFGIEFNKFGFMLTTLLLFYFVKNLVTYFFFASIDNIKNYHYFAHAAQKYYLIYSMLIMVVSLLHYYLPLNTRLFFRIYLVVLIFAFVLKILYYLFNNQRILPKQFYYKFLYICSLQILPILVVWKFCFI